MTAPATTPPTAAADDGGDDDGGNSDLTPPSTTPVTAPTQTQAPGSQNSAPSYQYAPAPVVSGAS